MVLVLHVDHFFSVIEFYMGIKIHVFKFHRDSYLSVFNFAIFFTITKNAKLKTHKVKYQ